MFAAMRFRHMAIVGVLCSIAFPGSEISAQLICSPDWTPEYKCLEHCGPCGGTSGGDSSGGNYGALTAEIMGIPGDIIRAHRKAKEAREAKKLRELDDQGVAAYDKKDWSAAEAYFEQALKLNPSEHVYLRNLAMTLGREGQDAYRKGDYPTALNYFQQALANDPADDPDKHTLNGDLATVQGKIADIRRDQEQRDKDKLAASKMQQSIQNLAQSMSAAPSSNTATPSGGLDFNDGKSGNNTDKPSELTFMDSDHPLKDAVADRTCTFGTACNPNPNLGGSPTDAAVTSNSTPEQLSSAAKSGKDAATAETLEKAKDLSNCQFDEKGCRTPDAINIPRPAQTPGAVELAKHIPPGPARDDKQIQQSMAYYQKLDGEKIGTKSKLEAVQKQIDSHAGDATILNAQKATLSNDLKRYQGDQEKTQAQIKERLVTIGVKWDESPARTTGAKSNQ